jgi:PAS domain-containing protein
MLSIVQDITERKSLGEALCVSEEKLRIALEVGHMDSWDWDIESDSIHWSTDLDAIFGLVRGSPGMSFETFMELVHPQDRKLIDQVMRHALEEGIDFTVEFRIRFFDGTVRSKRIHGQVLHDEAGKPIRVIGISMDVPQGRQGVGGR